MSIKATNIRIKRLRRVIRALCAIVLIIGMAAITMDTQSASPEIVTIEEQRAPIYPATLSSKIAFASPDKTKEGHEYLVASTATGAKAIVLVTIENGPLNLRYGAEKIGKGQQLLVDSDDFPSLATTGLHASAELASRKSITGKSISEITRLGRPGMASGAGFMAMDEDILSVLHGDNEIVRRLGLKHPDFARPLFHVWNLLLREYELGKLGRFKDDIGSFLYSGREIHLRSQRTKGFQESIFNDEIKGAFDIEIWRELEESERKLLKKAYGHLSTSDWDAMIGRLTRLRTGEIEPYYIMRYGFYEGHTEYRVDPIVIAFIFGLKPIAEIEKSFSSELDQVLTRHFTAKANALVISSEK